MLHLILQSSKTLSDSLALFGLLAILLSRHSLVHISAGLEQIGLVIHDYVATVCDSRRTRMIGHLSLADVYAKEFLSDVTDGAGVKHASISVIGLQTGVRRNQALPSRRQRPDWRLKKDGLTSLGIVLHICWHWVLSMFSDKSYV
jgi:hypothetical protein